MKKQMGIVAFTHKGYELALQIQELLTNPLEEICWQPEVVLKPSPLKEWCQKQFEESGALIFIGAMGIAVRTIAPFLKSKVTDPAVLVLDEQGSFVISVLSGHLGGGNRLACALAQKLGAVPVITTASDVNKKLAVDVFAQRNRLFISSMEQAKAAAAAIVAGKKVSFSCDGPVKGEIPKELSVKEEEAEFQILVSPYLKERKENLLQLIPGSFILGIGCRRGKSLLEIEARVKEELDKKRISIHSIRGVATIDLKKEEAGLLEFGEKYRIPITFYSSQELLKVPGDFSSSGFVQTVTGVDNVCERAAVKLARQEKAQPVFEIEKSGKDGVTIALVKTDWSVEFE